MGSITRIKTKYSANWKPNRCLFFLQINSKWTKDPILKRLEHICLHKIYYI